MKRKIQSFGALEPLYNTKDQIIKIGQCLHVNFDIDIVKKHLHLGQWHLLIWRATDLSEMFWLNLTSQQTQTLTTINYNA